jgi:hypothetical protein
MPSVKATVEIPLETPLVYGYLRDRYDGKAYRSACLATKGYVPPVAKTEDIENTKLGFYVPGRDSLLKFPTSSWTWKYELESPKPNQTRVTIEYKWSWMLSVLSFWTVRLQAANELAETVMAIEALTHGRT